MLIEFIHDYAAHHSGDQVEARPQFADLMVRLGLAKFVGPEEKPSQNPSEAELAGPVEKPAIGPTETPLGGPGGDLTKIRGIGGKRAAELARGGFLTLEDLRGADPVRVAEMVGVGVDKVLVWQGQARMLLRG